MRLRTSTVAVANPSTIALPAPRFDVAWWSTKLRPGDSCCDYQPLTRGRARRSGENVHVWVLNVRKG